MFIYHHRLVYFSLLIKEVSLKPGHQLMQKLTVNQSAENKHQLYAQPQMEYLSLVTSGTPQGLRIRKEGAKKIGRPEIVEDWSQTVSSGHNSTAILINSW